MKPRIKVMTMRYIGMDSHNRPVYQDENGKLWKDTDPRSHVPPSLLSASNNAFDGEPGLPYRGSFQLLPKRVTW